MSKANASTAAASEAKIIELPAKVVLTPEQKREKMNQKAKVNMFKSLKIQTENIMAFGFSDGAKLKARIAGIRATLDEIESSIETELPLN